MPQNPGGVKVGDPAPKLCQGRYVQGEEVKEFESGKAYLIEFWGPWCIPCRYVIPHLNELHVQFKDKGLVVHRQAVQRSKWQGG